MSKHFHVFRLHFFIPSFCSFYPLICCPSYHSGLPPNAFSGLILNMLPHRWYDTNWIVALKKCFMEISNLDSKLCMISLTYEKSTFFFKTQQLQLLQVSILKWHWVKNSLQPAQIPVHYLPLNAESQASADAHCTVWLPRFFLGRGIIPQKDPGVDKHDAGVSRSTDTKPQLSLQGGYRRAYPETECRWPRPGKTGSGFCKSHVPRY